MTYVRTGMYTRSTDYCVLQVTVSRDSSSNDFSLDAGALVLADQGLQICIKCTHTYACLHTCIIRYVPLKGDITSFCLANGNYIATS